MHPHAQHPIVGLVLLALFLFGFFSAFLAAADFSALNREIAQALLEALRDTGYTQKEIYLAMGYSKGQWSKVLSGEKPLGIVRLHRTPFRFYTKVFERLLVVKARDFAHELREDASVVRQHTAEQTRVA